MYSTGSCWQDLDSYNGSNKLNNLLLLYLYLGALRPKLMLQAPKASAAEGIGKKAKGAEKTHRWTAWPKG
jgi:hypothetical protein